MGKYYFKIMFSIYAGALVVCGALRFILKLNFTDPDTGFFTSTAGIIPIIFYSIYGIAIASMLILNRLRRGNDEYPVQARDGLIFIFRIAVGAAIIAFTLLGLPEHFGQSAILGKNWETAITIVNYIAGIASGIFFVIAGFAGLIWGKTPNSFMMIFPAIWQIILLLSRFNGYYAVLYISDSLLAVLFMVFATLFYLGHARTACGLGRKDGRNYVISAGLSASLCGFLFALPELINIHAAQASLFECIYTLILSLYTLYYVIIYSRSVKQV